MTTPLPRSASRPRRAAAPIPSRASIRAGIARVLCALRMHAALAAAWLVLVWGLTTATAVHADSEIARGTRVFLEQQIIDGGEVEVVVGEPDPRLALAPCARFEPFIPPGAKLWGRSSLGVRCVEGAQWTIYVPVQVKVYAPVQVAARPLPRGHPIGPEDVRPERLDLTQIRGTAMSADASLDGLVTTRPLAAGEPLRRDLVKAPPVVAPGDPVKVVVDGLGFSVATDGKALSAAGEGESVRIATAAGRVLTGIARAGRIVTVK